MVTARPIVGGVVAALRSLQREHGLAGEVTVSDVARFPGRPGGGGGAGRGERGMPDGDPGRAGARPGRRRSPCARRKAPCSATSCRPRSARIDAGAGRVDTLTGEGKAARREALTEKIRGLCADMGLDDTRLYQEVARLVERHDIAEEVQRLRSHVAQARDAVAAGAACGKRLDFLAQEMAREVNTIGSKAATAAVVHEVVALKEEIERVREQVQNVE